jgi:predicted nucleic acid-binding protein
MQAMVRRKGMSRYAITTVFDGFVAQSDVARWSSDQMSVGEKMWTRYRTTNWAQ